jgi:peptidoglycan/LPS O-acetylase OafA/YrhL
MEITAMRNVGLDIARSMAIIMVIVSHGRGFFTQYGDVQWVSFNGFLGVELFFVLSGFLIGKIMINNILECPTLENLLVFYKRRWFRTLPLYYLMVVVLAIAGKPFDWSNIFFLQNFDSSHLGFFPVSWSLSIEEWFYLLVPLMYLVIFFFSKSSDKGKLFLSVTVFFLILINLVRVLYVAEYEPAWDYGVRKQIYLRMDSVLTGVLFAGIKQYYVALYKSLEVIKLYLVSISGITLYVYYYVFSLEGGGGN